MVIPVFDGETDAYWWVLCTEKYFKKWLTPETLKMTVAGLAMKGPALTWWLHWYPCHRWVDWDSFTTMFLWRFKPEWRLILPLPDDEEELEVEPQQLVQGDNIDEQPTMVDERINDSNQFSSSHVVSDLDLALSIKDPVVQSPVPPEIPLHRPLFVEPKSQDGDNTIQPYELITTSLDIVSAVAGEQKDLINTICKDKGMDHSSCFTLVTFSSASTFTSMKAMMDTTSTTSRQHSVPLFDPGGYLNLQESWIANRALLPPPKPPYQNDIQWLIYLIKFYANFGWVYSAQKVFAKMSERSIVSWLADGSNTGYFHDVDYEIPPKPPDAISKRECTPEAFKRVCRFTISPPPLKFSFSATTMILTRENFPMKHVQKFGIIKNNNRHKALLVGSCLMDCIKSLLEKHKITGGFYLGSVPTIGYKCNCVIGSTIKVIELLMNWEISSEMNSPPSSKETTQPQYLLNNVFSISSCPVTTSASESVNVVFLVTVILPTSTCDPYINDAYSYCDLSTDFFRLCYAFKEICYELHGSNFFTAAIFFPVVGLADVLTTFAGLTLDFSFTTTLGLLITLVFPKVDLVLAAAVFSLAAMTLDFEATFGLTITLTFGLATSFDFLSFTFEVGFVFDMGTMGFFTATESLNKLLTLTGLLEAIFFFQLWSYHFLKFEGSCLYFSLINFTIAYWLESFFSVSDKIVFLEEFPLTAPTIAQMFEHVICLFSAVIVKLMCDFERIAMVYHQKVTNAIECLFNKFHGWSFASTLSSDLLFFGEVFKLMDENGSNILHLSKKASTTVFDFNKCACCIF